MVFLSRSEFAEEILQKLAAFVFENTSCGFYMMVVRKIEQMIPGTDGSALRVGCSEINVPDMRLDDRAGAHVAGLQSHIQVAVEDVPGRELAAGFRDCDHLGMKRGILLCLAEIVGTGDDLTVFDDVQDTVNHHFASLCTWYIVSLYIVKVCRRLSYR